MMALLSFATSKLGIGILIAAAVVIGLAWVFMEGKEAGLASAGVAAAVEAARRAQAAARARAKVDQSDEAIRNDPHNRDNR